MTNFAIDYSSLSDTIRVGRLNKKGDTYLDKQDKTAQAVEAVCRYISDDFSQTYERIFSFDGGKTHMKLTLEPCEAPNE